jgi:hypothetical protein
VPNKLGVLCGSVAAACLVGLHASGEGLAACRPTVVRVGAVSARGCWSHGGRLRRAPTPVQLDGLTLAGGGAVTVDAGAGAITSSRSVRWRFGQVQIRRAPFAWRRGRSIAFTPSGAVRGLTFQGGAVLSFTPAAGGTAQLTGSISVPVLSDVLSGSVVVASSRLHGFDVRSVRVALPQLSFGRLVFKQLAFRYTGAAWDASATVALPGFGAHAPDVSGEVEIARGKLAKLAADISGIAVPLADGFELTAAGFSVTPSPLALAGKATATFGPPVGGSAAIEVQGNGGFTTAPDVWTAGGTLTLPWLPVFSPHVTGTVTVRPGTAMQLNAALGLTVHGWGLTATIDGFATAHAFNAEGAATLHIPGPDLHGSALASSVGAAACGSMFFGPHVGFGYHWGGSLHLMYSSCDVGPWRVTEDLRRRPARTAASSIPVTTTVPFELFGAQGGDFSVTDPTGATVSSVVDRNGPDAFVTHDREDGWAFVVIPAPPVGVYTVDPVAGTTLKTVNAADGLPPPIVEGSVTDAPGGATLNWSIGNLAPGEAVAFYQGASPLAPGAAPVVEGLGDGVGSQFITPEPLGPPVRSVWMVVTNDGLPIDMRQFGSFDATPAAPPGPVVASIQPAAGGAGWTLIWKTARAATWQALVQTTDGRSYWLTLTGQGGSQSLPEPPGVGARVSLTPYDVYGQAGPTATCDSASPGRCPTGK